MSQKKAQHCDKHQHDIDMAFWNEELGLMRQADCNNCVNSCKHPTMSFAISPCLIIQQELLHREPIDTVMLTVQASCQW